MKRSITAQIAVFAAITFILLSFIGAIAYQEILKQIEAGQNLLRTGDVCAELEKTASLVKALEKEDESHAIARNADGMKLHSQVTAAIDSHLNRLNELKQRQTTADQTFRLASDKVIAVGTIFILVTIIMLVLVVFFVQHYERERTKTEAIQQAIGLKFSGVFNQSSETIFLLDPEGKILQANETGLRLVGAKREDVVGLAYWETK